MYINKRKQETDLPVLATGYFIAGVLCLGVPVLFNVKVEGIKWVRQSCTLLAITSSIASGCFHRRIHRVLVPMWLEIEELESEYRLKAIDLELSEEFDKQLVESSTRLTQHANQTLEAVVKPANELPSADVPVKTSDAPKAAQRLLDELTEEQRKDVLKNYEKTLDVNSDKGFNDLDANDIQSEKTSENPTDSHGIQGQIEQIRILVQIGGLKLPDAVKKVSGVSSNHRAYRELRDAYKAKYGDA